ncbi:high-affinity glucose transporter ght2 [Sodiomyces alkalinus F11]|uniref:High-affinity glucose transporter ght2 n=1 Tax=Sodiomyces alkalinus (strain CBS 110278 / VKM F-3762 / F11) TaxID=1314773 RepID=A0A3N2PNQ9_SODAK|nr:high-affinity glucose transporter ght2 [Sodiomyces alkalinus F11]ROT36139.1 high-affinity glucose transporter ght2 [Sodiomyces alkalinus F11]
MGLGKLSVRINGAECGVEAILLGVVTSIGGFLFGYDTGQISGMLLFTDFRRRFATETDSDGNADWNPLLQSLLVSLMSIGTLLGALSGAYTADWWGRRKSLSFGVAIFIIGNIVQITAMNTWVHMMMGRFVAGLGVGNLSVGVPMFQSECAPREIRGAVVASYQLAITFGILISNIINFGVRNIQDSDASWRIVIGLGLAFSLPLGIGVLAVPESPRWLAARHDWDGARLSLARLRGLKHDPQHQLVEMDVREMYKVLEEESRVGVGSWAECFTGRPSGIPKLVYRTFLGAGIHFLQQWTGVNYFFYYGATIFESAGVDDPILTQLILGAVNVVMTFYGLYIVEKYGRRWPLFLGALWQAVWLCIFASVGVALPPEDNPTTGIVMIVAACMFIASFAGTWGPMAWVVIGETFPVRTRAKQASFATACNWLGNFLISFLSPIADDGIGYAYGYVFVACNLVGAAVIWFFFYESRALSLENVDRMYGQPHVKPWTSNKWVPPGYITREKRDPNAYDDDAGVNDAAAAGARAEIREKRGERSNSEEPIASHVNGSGSSPSPSDVEAGKAKAQ